jgi:hypothetical protein
LAPTPQQIHELTRVGIISRLGSSDRPFVSAKVEVDQQYSSGGGVVSLPLLSLDCAPVMIHMSEAMIRRAVLLAQNLIDLSAMSVEKNSRGQGGGVVKKPQKVFAGHYNKILTQLFGGVVKHNLYIAFRSSNPIHSDGSEASTFVDLMDEAALLIASQLIKWKSPRPSAQPLPKLYLQNVHLPSLNCELTGNIELLSSFSSALMTQCHSTHDNNTSGGIQRLLTSVQNVALLFARVLTSSAIRYGKIPLRIDSVELPFYFGDAEALLFELMLRYQKVISRQIAECLTPNSLVNTMKSLTNYATVCLLATASDAISVTQLMLTNAAADSQSLFDAIDAKAEANDRKNQRAEPKTICQFQTSDLVVAVSPQMSKRPHRQPAIVVPKTLLDGVFRSLTGLYLDPITGLKKNGGIGLVSGLVKASIGLPLRPTYGLLNQIKGMLVAWTGSPLSLEGYQYYGGHYQTVPHNVLLREECQVDQDPRPYHLYATREELLLLPANEDHNLVFGSASHHQVHHQLRHSQIVSFEDMTATTLSDQLSFSPLPELEIELNNTLITVPLASTQLTMDENEAEAVRTIAQSQGSSRDIQSRDLAKFKYGVRLRYCAANTQGDEGELLLWFGDAMAREELGNLLKSFARQREE